MCNSNTGILLSTIRSVKKCLEKPPIVYVDGEHNLWDVGSRNATDAEMRTWLSDRGNQSLVTSLVCARGWEDSIVLAVVEDKSGGYNMYLRAVSHLSVVYTGPKIPRYERKLEPFNNMINRKCLRSLPFYHDFYDSL